jgi:hypothetical protein
VCRRLPTNSISFLAVVPFRRRPISPQSPESSHRQAPALSCLIIPSICSSNDSTPPHTHPPGTTHNDYYKFTMAPVIAWAEASTHRAVTVTFSLDIRDAALAQRFQARSHHHHARDLSPFLLPRTALLTLHQRNHNNIVDDVIAALHKLSERHFIPEIVSLCVPNLHPSPATALMPLQVLASVEGKPIAPFWRDNISRLMGTAEAPLSLIRDKRPSGCAVITPPPMPCHLTFPLPPPPTPPPLRPQTPPPVIFTVIRSSTTGRFCPRMWLMAALQWPFSRGKHRKAL